MGRTSDHNYYEDFAVGEIYEHTRGKTVTEMDNVAITNLVLNTAQGHFNEDRMEDSEFGERIVYGGINLSMVCGLASEDISENAITELGYDEVRFSNPVFHGDTLYAESEVLSKRDSDARSDGGVVEFRVRGYNQDDEQVVGATKRVLLKKREYYGDD
ncbi:acyl dehydratase [Natrinema sp. CBA1119]|uniref:MaoC family dehydratase n=1 Tax=Natrinema sp. CBA1119 TaxID=1608465 RepID=UPI000BF9C792|nr:MaoC family dehydratase [Natrinema sp. CBA1119]PGF13858.1 acyl dehydratase [Natrinema sp. CBA1119]